VRGSSARMFLYRGGEKGFQLGNLLWRHPSKVAEVGKDPFAKVYVEEVQRLMQQYGPLIVPGRQRGWLVGPEDVAFVDWHLKRLMTNEMSERPRRARPCGRTASRRTRPQAPLPSLWAGCGRHFAKPFEYRGTKACTRAPSQTETKETAAALCRLSFVAAERSHHCLLATSNWQVLWKLGTGSSRLTQWNGAQT
jgi:hypothetical protein